MAVDPGCSTKASLGPFGWDLKSGNDVHCAKQNTQECCMLKQVCRYCKRSSAQQRNHITHHTATFHSDDSSAVICGINLELTALGLSLSCFLHRAELQIFTTNSLAR
jgi:hypothetical protein